MGSIKTKGIIIAEHNSGDFDKMVTLLTPGFGKIGCGAKGSRKPKSLLLAGTQFLCFGEYMLYKGTNSYSINSCETIESFYNLRCDLDKLNYSTYITKIVADITYENVQCANILQLFLNTLYTICNLEKDLELVLATFKIKVLCLLGYTPNVRECKGCKETKELTYFSFKEDTLKCKICGKQDKSAISLEEGTINAIKYIIMAPNKKLYSFNVSSNVIDELKMFSKLYMNNKLEKEYR